MKEEGDDYNLVTFFFYVGNQTLHHLFVGEEAAGNYTYHCVGRNSGKHAQDASDVSGEKHHNEDFKRCSLDAGRVDDGLQNKIVDSLNCQHDGNDNKCKNPNVDIQTDAGALV